MMAPKTRRHPTTAGRLDWPALLVKAAAIVRAYSTRVTLRQLFYRLVSAALLPNTQGAYKHLSSHTAAARRSGTFPPLMDRTRRIHRGISFAGPRDAVTWLRDIYQRDHTEGQPFSLYLAVEKAGIVSQLEEWFSDYGMPVIALGGYSSESYDADVVADVRRAGRPAVLISASDCDASGEDLHRHFVAMTDCWHEVRRVALTADQIARYDLPLLPGKTDEHGDPSDSRANGFIAKHGAYFQVELDALDPDVLRQLFADAIADFWDEDAYRAVLAREQADRRALARVRLG